MSLSLKRLFRRPQRQAPPPAQLPPGTRVYAIGDVHGRLDLLDRLLAMIESDNATRDPTDTTLIFLGDLIDRGPDSAGVIARAIDLEQSGCRVRFIGGNHEEVLLTALEGRDGAMRLFTRIGGGETLLSYGVPEDEYLRADFDELIALARDRIPEAHRLFLERMEDHIELGDYLFVHAGIRPGIPLLEQSGSDLRWIRGEFLNHSGRHPHVVVHGHSIRESIEMPGNRIGIDTGAWQSGCLSALGLEEDRAWTMDTA